MTVSFRGWLEIDHRRGVVYFHADNEATIKKFGTVTLLRICQLPTPIPIDTALDITHNYGANWGVGERVIDAESVEECINLKVSMEDN